MSLTKLDLPENRFGFDLLRRYIYLDKRFKITANVSPNPFSSVHMTFAIQDVWKAKICLVLSFIIMTSCASLDKRDVSYGTYTYFLDHDLKMRLALFGDYTIHLENKRPHHFRKVLQKTFLNLRRKNFLFYAQTDDPFFECIAFKVAKHDSLFYFRNGFYKNLNRFESKSLISEATGIIFNQYIVPLAEVDIYLISFTSKQLNSNFDLPTLNQTAKSEYSQILESMFQGSAFATITLDPFMFAEKAFFAQPEGNYLLPIVELEARKDFYLNSDFKDFFFQAICSYASFSGDHSRVNKYMQERQFTTDVTGEREFKFPPHYNLSLIGTSIYDTLRQHNVVMFNESHFQAKHRLLVSKLLGGLYNEGFRYLALEALTEPDNSIKNRAFPTLQSGFYFREYQMANLVRTAIGLGYHIISYEDYLDSIQGKREYNQALTLFNKTLKHDVAAKVVVLAGHSHITEKSTSPDGKKWMAQYFEEISGIDPFTVNQTSYANFGNIDFEERAQGVYYVSDPKTRLQGNDLYLTHNLACLNEVYLGDKKYVEYDFEFPDRAKMHDAKNIFHVFLKGEIEQCINPVPCFTKIINEESIKLAIPEGIYLFKIKTGAGNILYEETHIIK